MKLSKAASYFAKTSVSGWSGTEWVPNIAKIAIMPSDRFISVHEFDTNCQYALVPTENMGLDEYTVIRVDATEQIFIVGFKTNDVSGDIYSKFYLLRRADSIGTLYEFTKTFAASGTAMGVTRQAVGEFFCDVERVTSTPSRLFKTSKFSDCIVILPADCDLQTNQEIKVKDVYFDVKHVYENSGFKMCRAIGKKSA